MLHNINVKKGPQRQQFLIKTFSLCNYITFLFWGKISASHCDKKCSADIAAKNIIIGPKTAGSIFPKCGIILILFPQCQYHFWLYISI